MMETIWQSAVDFVAVNLYISPFWYWVFVGSGVIVVSSLLSWFFPVLRSLAGAVVMAVLAGLVGYRRGETDAETHDAKKAKTKLW